MNAAGTLTKPMAGKQAKINELKERYSGRGDLLSMMEEGDGDDVANYESFELADEEEVDPPTNGQTITGTVIEMDDSGALLEIGGKMSGYLPIKEASLITVKHMNEVLKVGQEVTAEVIGTLKVGQNKRIIFYCHLSCIFSIDECFRSFFSTIKRDEGTKKKHKKLKKITSPPLKLTN